jgi:hypothetical protein
VSDEEKKAAEEPKAGAEAPKARAHHHRSKHAAGKGKKDGGMVTKVVATVFGAVVAPILVAVGIQWVKDRPAATPKETKETKETKPAPDRDPKETNINLVTHGLSKRFYTFAWNPDLGKDERKDAVDPALFRYEESPDRIVVPGGARPVLLTTKDEFEDYTLNFWYRWGEKQWGRAEGRPRRACILLHITGADGAFNGIFPTCVCVNLSEGDAGSIRLMGVPNRITCTAKVKESPDRLRREFVGGDAKETPQATFVPEEWKNLILRRDFPAGVDRDGPAFLVGAPIKDTANLAVNVWSSVAQCQFQQSVGAGTIPYLVAAARSAFRARGITVEKGFHPEGDPLIRPPYQPGAWNRVVIECGKGTVSVSINRKKVNEITGLNLKKGRIAIGSQLNEYEIGKIVIEVKEPDRPPEKDAEKAPEKPPRKGRS